MESRSPSPSLPDVVRSIVEEDGENEDQAAADPEILSETMAPPMSSSDCEADEHQGSKSLSKTRNQRKRRGATAEEDGEGSDHEQTNRRRQAKGKVKAKNEESISTAKLQALLPKRRMRAKHDESDSASVIGSDEDELSMPPRRHAQLARKMAATKASKKSAHAAKKTAPTSRAPKGSRTYGRRISSDKENEGRVEVDEDSEDEDSGHTEIADDKPSSNLQAMAKKFEDIDAFDLDFESVSYVQTSSSPWR